MSLFTFSHAVIWALFAIVIVGFSFFRLFILFKYSLDSFVQITRISDIYHSFRAFLGYINIRWTSVCFLQNSSIGYNCLSTFRLKQYRMRFQEVDYYFTSTSIQLSMKSKNKYCRHWMLSAKRLTLNEWTWSQNSEPIHFDIRGVLNIIFTHKYLRSTWLTAIISA